MKNLWFNLRPITNYKYIVLCKFSLFKKDSASEDVSLTALTSLLSCEKSCMECVETASETTLPSLEEYIFNIKANTVRVSWKTK